MNVDSASYGQSEDAIGRIGVPVDTGIAVKMTNDGTLKVLLRLIRMSIQAADAAITMSIQDSVDLQMSESSMALPSR